MLVAEMEIQSEDPLCRISDLITVLIRHSSSEERRKLELALSVFAQCMTRHTCMDSETEHEIEEQIEWIRLYRGYQGRCPTYRLPLGDSLIPVTQDTEHLMPHFAHEVLEGSRTVAHMLTVQPPARWTYVSRLRLDCRGSEVDGAEQQSEHEPDKSDAYDSEAETVADDQAIAYSYAYF